MDTNTPHRRYNPLEDRWVLVSPQRMNRPWSGQTEEASSVALPSHDPKCYLCPGNKRTSGQKNPEYRGQYFFENDFSALLQGASKKEKHNDGLLIAKSETGVCEVVCYSHQHNSTMAELPDEDITKIIGVWADRYRELGSRPDINHVQIFENRGAEVGNSSPHPHGQIWAQASIPSLVKQELDNQKKYFEKKGVPLLVNYLKQEEAKNERIVYENKDFVVLVPYWATWPFELMILPRRNVMSLTELLAGETEMLAESLSKTVKAFGKLFGRTPAETPYTMGIHQAPTDDQTHLETTLHFHFHPPMLTPTRQKFMVGYERFGEAQRDLTPELAARQIKKELG